MTMFRVTRVLTVISGVLRAAIIAEPAAAQQSKPSTPDDNIVVTAPHYETKVVCKYQALGATRFQTRECYTNKEWDRMRDETIRLAHEMIDSPKINPYP